MNYCKCIDGCLWVKLNHILLIIESMLSGLERPLSTHIQKYLRKKMYVSFSDFLKEMLYNSRLLYSNWELVQLSCTLHLPCTPSLIWQPSMCCKLTSQDNTCFVQIEVQLENKFHQSETCLKSPPYNLMQMEAKVMIVKHYFVEQYSPPGLAFYFHQIN